MEAQKITKEVIESLPSGLYLIFYSDRVVDSIFIQTWIDTSRVDVISFNGFNTPEDYLKKRLIKEDCYIILASEVKLKQYECQGDCLGV